MSTENVPAVVAPAAPPAPTLARAIASPKELVDRHKELTALIKEAFEEKVDFGMVPGTKKNTLFKPGAERMCIAFGAHPQYELVTSEVDHLIEVPWTKNKSEWTRGPDGRNIKQDRAVTGMSVGLYRYIYKCKIVRYDGRVLGEGEGSCSTLEAKYCDRPRDLENTVIKMAQKRAMIAAVLNAFGLSDRFTQDLEDHDHDDEPAPPPPKPQGPPPFNARDKADIDWLKAEPEVADADATVQKKIALALHGRPKTDLAAATQEVLEEIKRKAETEQRAQSAPAEGAEQ